MLAVNLTESIRRRADDFLSSGQQIIFGGRQMGKSLTMIMAKSRPASNSTKTIQMSHNWASILKGYQQTQGLAGVFEKQECWKQLTGVELLQVCRKIRMPSYGIGKNIQSLFDDYTFNVLEERRDFLEQLESLIVLDQSMVDLHLELWHSKTSANKNHHKKVYQDAIERLTTAYTEYEVMRRLIDPDTAYLRYTPINLHK